MDSKTGKMTGMDFSIDTGVAFTDFEVFGAWEEITLGGELDIREGHKEYLDKIDHDLLVYCLYLYLGHMLGNTYGTATGVTITDKCVTISTNHQILLKLSYTNAKNIVDDIKDTKKARRYMREHFRR